MRRLSNLEAIELYRAEAQEDEQRRRTREQAVASVEQTFQCPQEQFNSKMWELVTAHERRTMGTHTTGRLVPGANTFEIKR